MDKPVIVGDAAGHYRNYCDGAPAAAVPASRFEYTPSTRPEQFRALTTSAFDRSARWTKRLRRNIIADYAARCNSTSRDLDDQRGSDVPGVDGWHPAASDSGRYRLLPAASSAGAATETGRGSAMILGSIGKQHAASACRRRARAYG